ncbi:MAG TPA: type II secretion system protein [Candidatus Saccharimonadales bacterium]|nr:type II secretion system protein [Candidatus Saccharimonadales bacterium]
MRNRQGGFTIPELIVVLAVSLALSNLIIFFGFNFWRTAALQQADQDTLISRLNAGDLLRENLGESSGLIIQNGLPDSNTLNADPNQAGGQYWVPIHAIPSHVLVGNSGTTTPLLYFRKYSVNTSKNIILNGTVPYEDEFVLYLNGTSKQLLMRSIANTNAPNNRLLSSCPLAIASSSCPADKVVADNVASIDSRYFSRNGTLLDYSSSTDPNTGNYNGPDFPVVEVIELTINLQVKAALEHTNSTQNSTVIRIALRNS